MNSLQFTDGKSLMGAANRDGAVYQIQLPAGGYTESFTETVAKALVISAWLFLDGRIGPLPRGPATAFEIFAKRKARGGSGLILSRRKGTDEQPERYLEYKG